MNRAIGTALLLAFTLCATAWPTTGALDRDAQHPNGGITNDAGEPPAAPALPSGSAGVRGIGSGRHALAHPDDEVPLGGDFSPPHDDAGQDLNQNKLYDFLVVMANITVDTAEDFTVAGNLYKQGTSLFLFNGTSLFLEPGMHTVPIFFDGPLINASGVDGPYTVGLFLWDAFRTPLADDLYTTRFYAHTAFDTVPAEFAPPHYDDPLDTDGDRRFNVLNVHVNVSVHTAAQYHVNAFLTDENLMLSMSASATVALSPGPQAVVLPFAGDLLNASGVNGPYFVTMTLFILPTFVAIDHGEHDTAPYNHTQFEEPTVLASKYAPAPPAINGTIGDAEWRSAREVNLSTIPGNDLPAFLLVMNDDDFLYVAYDAVGDTVLNGCDVAAIAFDTGNDERATVGDEDEFVQGGCPNTQAHYIFAGNENWSISDSPFNPNLPNQAGLAGARGFGPSPKSPADHRIYEFQIPLVLLGAGPGDVLAFFGGSHADPFAGVLDEGTFAYSTWPIWTDRPIPLRGYGDLVLARGEGDTVPPTIEITSPAPGTIEMTDSVTVTWTAFDDGSGLDRFEVRVDNQAPTTVRPPEMSYTALAVADGPHTIIVTAFDIVGNPQSARVQVTVDTAAPTVTIVAPQAEYLRAGTFAVNWTATDAGSGLDKFEVVVDGETPDILPGTARSHILSDLADGPHDIRVTAFDVAGRTAFAPVTVTIDTVPPAVAITSPQTGSVIPSTDVTISFTRDDDSGIIRIEIALDSGPQIPVDATATSYAFTRLSDGEHSVTLTVFDRAGNSRTESVTFRVDTAFFSPSGPYGVAGMGVVAALLVGGFVAALAITRRGRRGRPPRYR